MSVRAIDVIRGATVRICNENGDHFGQGLMLLLENEGRIVLTCHHVVAQLDEEHLYIAIPISGTLNQPIKAIYDVERSRPTMDAAVLRIKDQLSIQPSFEQPLLHNLDPSAYDGTLPERAICLGHWKGNSFDARISTTTQLDIAVENRGPWPNAPTRYQLPFVFRLADPTDARPGISGSVVIYEKGVIGLAHFSRPAGPDQEREVYLVPLSVWAEGWSSLHTLIEPLIDSRLGNVAKVKPVKSVKIGADIVIAGYRSDIYICRELEQRAHKTLEQSGGVIIVGKPKSGKTRLAWRLIEERKDSILIIPFEARPPIQFETSALVGKQIILLFDDLHRSTLDANPFEWSRRMETASGRRCLVICTTRDGKDLKRVEENSASQLFNILGKEAYVFTSRFGDKGNDLTKIDGLALAQQLNISQSEFAKRFDGTPGSLTLDLMEMNVRYKRLCDEERLGVSMSRLLDAAKIAYEASQPRVHISVLRSISEQIRGVGALSAEAWETLQRRTSEEGFGVFDKASGEFQTYKPYLEDCVDFQPSKDDFKKLIAILLEQKDHSGLLYLGYALWMRFQDNEEAERCFRISVDLGNQDSETLLGFVLSEKNDQKDEAEIYCRRKIAEGFPTFNLGLARMLSKQQGREVEAEEAFRQAMGHYKSKEYKRLVKGLYGNFLAFMKGREKDAEALLREAADEGYLEATSALALFLLKQPGRQQESLDTIEAAIRRCSELKESDELSESISGKVYSGSQEEKNGQEIDKLYYFKGQVCASISGMEEEAERLLKDALNKGTFEAYPYLGLLLLKFPDRKNDAEAYFRQGMQAKIIGCVYGLATVLASQEKRHEEAEMYLRQSIVEGQISANRDLGVLLAKQGRFYEAEIALRLADDNGCDVGIDLGFVLEKQPGREREAIAAYRNQMFKGNKDAFLSILHLLTVRDDISNDIGEKLLREAIGQGMDADLELAIHLTTRVVVYGVVHLADEAEALLRRLTKSNDRGAKEWLGALLIHKGEYNEAKILLEEAKAEGCEFAKDLLSRHSTAS